MCGEKLYICFTDDDGHWYSKYLKDGIRHCFVIKAYRQHFIIYSRNTKRVELYTLQSIKDIIGSGLVISCDENAGTKSLFMLNTCTGHVKQMLGINKPFIWTPWQLLKYVRRTHGFHEKT